MLVLLLFACSLFVSPLLPARVLAGQGLAICVWHLTPLGWAGGGGERSNEQLDEHKLSATSFIPSGRIY